MDGKSIKILNIEDEDVDHLALLRMVREKGLAYEVERAANIAEAADLLEKNKYDAVLIDYRLPDGTGLDVLDKLHETASIFVTGSGDESVAVKAMKGGARDYLIKDPNGAYLEMLPTVIDKAMEAVKLEKEREELESSLKEELDAMTLMNRMLVGREARIEELKNENKLMKKYIAELERKG